MMAEVCERFGWTLDYALSMPASQFFVMLRSARRLRSRDMIELCWVSRASQLVPDAFESLVNGFRFEKETLPKKPQLPKQHIDARSDNARYAVMSAFAADTKINRTVKVH